MELAVGLHVEARARKTNLPTQSNAVAFSLGNIPQYIKPTGYPIWKGFPRYKRKYRCKARLT